MTNPTPSPAGVEIDGAKVRKARQLRGQNLVKFAPRCGITFQYLSQIERGNRPTVSPRTFAAICDALGLAEENREELIRPKATV